MCCERGYLVSVVSFPGGFGLTAVPSLQQSMGEFFTTSPGRHTCLPYTLDKVGITAFSFNIGLLFQSRINLL